MPLLRPEHTRRQIAATCRSNKFYRVNTIILSKILSPRQNFVAAKRRTKSYSGGLKLKGTAALSNMKACHQAKYNVMLLKSKDFR